MKFARTILGTLAFTLLGSGASAQVARLAVQGSDRQIELSVGSLSNLRAVEGRLRDSLNWQLLQPGLEWLELELAAGSLKIPLRAVLVRMDPRQFRFSLERATRANRMTGSWAIDSATSEAVFAVNAGQFKEAGPWGWLRTDGVDHGLPGAGALAYALAFDQRDSVHWIAPRDLNAARNDRKLLTAFQSYPQLLVNRRVPAPALNRKLVDHSHRDARLIMGQLPDGRLLFALTRFDALGPRAGRIPIGLTLPESILLASALGARHAIMLDGGVSAQLLLRDGKGTVHRWPGLRQVPVGMVAVPR